MRALLCAIAVASAARIRWGAGSFHRVRRTTNDELNDDDSLAKKMVWVGSIFTVKDDDLQVNAAMENGKDINAELKQLNDAQEKVQKEKQAEERREKETEFQAQQLQEKQKRGGHKTDIIGGSSVESSSSRYEIISITGLAMALLVLVSVTLVRLLKQSASSNESKRRAAEGAALRKCKKTTELEDTYANYTNLGINLSNVSNIGLDSTDTDTRTSNLTNVRYPRRLSMTPTAHTCAAGTIANSGSAADSDIQETGAI